MTLKELLFKQKERREKRKESEVNATDTPKVSSRSMTLKELGAKLRERREERKLTVDDAAGTLKISSRVLLDMEAGRDCLPRTVYAKHAIKDYAKYLGFSEEEIYGFLKGLEGFSQITAPAQLEKETFTPVRPGILPKLLTIAGKILAMALLAVGIYAAYSHFVLEKQVGRELSPSSFSTSVDSSSSASAPSVAETSQSPSEEKTDSGTPVVDSSQKNSSSSNTEPVGETTAQRNADTEAAPADSPFKESREALPEGMSRVEIVADEGDCWISYEPDGKKQQKTLVKGDTFSVTFRDSLVLRLGKPPAVRIAYNGKEMERPTSNRVVTLHFPPNP